MVKAVFFDFWGTLVENGTYSPLKQSYSILRIRTPYGDFVEKFERALMTKKFTDQTAAFHDVCEAFRIPPKPIIIDKLIGVWNKNRLLAKPYADTAVALESLKKKYKLAIVSNAPHGSVQEILEKFDMAKYFDEVFVSSEHGTLKADKLFEIALKKMKLDKEDVVMVGDGLQSDVGGAEKAGIKAILLDRNGRREYENKIESLTELEGML